MTRKKIFPKETLTTDIQLNHISIKTKAGRPRLDNISCTFSAGEIIAIIGPNGAGKSSLLSALSHHLPIQQGTISLFGHPLNQWSAPQRAQHLALLTQKQQLNMPFLVREVLDLSRLYQTSTCAQNTEITQKTLAAFDGHDLYDRYYTELSGGEQQRVHLARTFAQLNALSETAQRPGVLLLDEPAAALDLPHQRHLVSAIRTAAHNGLTVLVSLHDLTLAAQIATRILCLDQGQLKILGSVEAALEPHELAQVFRTPIERIQPKNSGTPVLYLDHNTHNNNSHNKSSA